jgi:hypothetical protein
VFSGLNLSRIAHSERLVGLTGVLFPVWSDEFFIDLRHLAFKRIDSAYMFFLDFLAVWKNRT